MTDCDPHDLAPYLSAVRPRSRPSPATLSVGATGARLPLTPRSASVRKRPAAGPWSFPRVARQRHRFPDRGCLPLLATSPRAPLALSVAERQPFGIQRFRLVDTLLAVDRSLLPRPANRAGCSPELDVPRVVYELLLSKEVESTNLGLPNRSPLLLRADGSRNPPLARCACRTYAA